MIPQKSFPAPSIELNTIQTDRFKTETLSVTVSLPLEKLVTPLYSLVLSILKRGTEKYPTQGHINRRLDELYATGLSLRADRYGDNYVLGFSAELLDATYTDGEIDILDGVLEVITQMLFHPLTEKNGLLLSRFVEREKTIACDAIQASINNPKSYASIRCREIMFDEDNHDLSIAGTVARIRAVTAEALTELYRDLIFERKFRVSYIGSKSKEQVGEQLLRHLGPYLSDPRDFVPDRNGFCPKRAICKRVDEKSEIAQGKLVIGMRAGVNILDEDFYPMLVFTELYGGSPVSKLFMNVREKLSLCYYCSAIYDIYKGTIFVSCGVDPEKREEAEAEIFRQLENIRAGHVTPFEFDAAVKSLLGSYRSISDQPSTLESYYAGRDLFGVFWSVEQCIEAIGAVTPEDVIRVSKKVETDTVYFLWGDAKDGEEDEDGSTDCV